MIKEKTATLKSYITSDGREFLNKDEALKHEFEGLNKLSKKELIKKISLLEEEIESLKNTKNYLDWNQIKKIKNPYEQDNLYPIIPTEPFWYGSVNSDCPHTISQEQYDKLPENEKRQYYRIDGCSVKL